MEFTSPTEAKPTKICEDMAEYLVIGPSWEALYCKTCMEKIVRSATIYGPEVKVREIVPTRS